MDFFGNDMQEQYPKISLATACFNHKAYIAETIESVLSQKYPNLQYIVVDDGSTDGSWDIIQRYKNDLAGCYRLEGYRDTVTIALNDALGKTDGQIMGWLNSDDIILPNSLFTMADIFRDVPDATWVTGMATTINFKSQIVNSNLRLKSEYDYLNGKWVVIQQESTFWRRELWNKAGPALNGKEKWAFDTELWTRFFEHAEHYHAEAPIGAFRKGQQSKSVSDKQSFLMPNMKHLAAMKKRATFSKRLNAYVYCVLGFCRPVLMWIPHRIFSRIPYLNRFSYKLLSYSFQNDRWEIHMINPWRNI